MLPAELPSSPKLIVRGLAGIAAALASLPSALTLLQWAARYNRHYYPSGRRSVGSPGREHPGLFLLAGAVALLPAIVGVVIPPVGQRRPAKVVAVLVAVLVVGIAGLCELVMSMAPDPWFAF